MGLILSDKSGGNFQPAPAGTHRAVCVDVVDLGQVETQYGTKPMLRLVWEIEERMDDGRPFIVSKRYTQSLNEKATLRHDLESWRGKPLTGDELAGFDTEKLIGAPALVNVMHRNGEAGKVWSNVTGIMPIPRTLGPIKASGSYTRVQDRKPNGNGAGLTGEEFTAGMGIDDPVADDYPGDDCWP